MNRNNLFSLPNIISLFRLVLLIPIFYLLSQNQRMLALAVIIVSGFSDFLDGYIARRWNLQSDAGRIIDPVADKINLVGLMFFLVISPNYVFPVWFFIIVMTRESMVLILSYVFIGQKKMVLESSTPGKVSAFATGMTIILSILNLAFYLRIMVWLALSLTVFSSLVYFQRFRKHYWNKRNS